MLEGRTLSGGRGQNARVRGKNGERVLYQASRGVPKLTSTQWKGVKKVGKQKNPIFSSPDDHYEGVLGRGKRPPVSVGRGLGGGEKPRGDRK